MSDKNLTYFKMQMLQAEIEMNAMIAENKLREAKQERPIYLEKDFLNLIDKYGIHHNLFPFIGE